MQEKPEKEGFRSGVIDSYNEDCNSNFCKVCFVAQTAAVLLPCRHFVCKIYLCFQYSSFSLHVYFSKHRWLYYY
jgi:hypothetical protein